MRRTGPLFLSLLLLACGGAEKAERIETAVEAAGEIYVHSPGAPVLYFEEAPDAAGLPWGEGEADPWVASLPVDAGGGVRPSILLGTDDAGGPAEMALWLDPPGDVDFSKGERIAISPYEEYEGYFWTDPFTVPVPSAKGEGGPPGGARLKGLLRVYPGGAQLRLYPEEVRTGRFPKEDVAFLVYDGDRNGIYDINDRLVIDSNRDGEFDGNRNSVELYGLGEPFLLGDEAYRLRPVHPDGSSFELARTDELVEPRDPLLPGEEAPDFELASIDGEALRFSRVSRGKPTLLAYWATW